jgi:hypothetical protein
MSNFTHVPFCTWCCRTRYPFVLITGPQISYEPGTKTLICENLKQPDPYEFNWVYVRSSRIKGAAEGLYAKQVPIQLCSNIHLVCKVTVSCLIFTARQFHFVSRSWLLHFLYISLVSLYLVKRAKPRNQNTLIERDSFN